MDSKTVEAFQLYIEKADKLRNSNFVKRITNSSGITLSAGVGKPTTISKRGPDDENIDAFILTFRFFIQDNELISLRNISMLFKAAVDMEVEATNVDNAREHLNNYLNGNTMFDINGPISRRVLMDTFIYGGLSHANPPKKKQYDSWSGIGVIFPFMQNEFSIILYEVLNVIVYIRNICEEGLQHGKAH